MTKKLEQTKGTFKVLGKVKRIDRDGAYKEGVAEKGARQGEVFRSLRFGVQTSPDNEITVSMYDYEPTEVFLWNSKLKQEDENYKGTRIPFGTWEEQADDLREEGYSPLQARVGLTYKEDGKLDSKGLPSFVASEEIFNNLDNGDSVAVEGEIRYGSFTNAQGQEVKTTNYTIKKVFKIKDIDFDAEDFEEISYFEQDAVFVDLDIDKKEGKAYIIGRTIDFQGNFKDNTFVVNFKDEDGKIDSDMVKLVDAIKGECRFGDVISMFGDTWNKVIRGEAQDAEPSEEDNLLAKFGGKKKPKHAENNFAKSYVTEFSVAGLDGLKKEVYTDEDFIDNSVVEKDEPQDNPFSGRGKRNNPFENLDEGNGEIEEDDLPF